MGGQTIRAAVVAGHHDADHFFLGIGEPTTIIEKRALEVQKSDVLLGVQRQHLEKVVDEPPVFFHHFYIFCKYGVFLIGHFRTVGFLQARKLFIKFQCHDSYSFTLL